MGDSPWLALVRGALLSAWTLLVTPCEGCPACKKPTPVIYPQRFCFGGPSPTWKEAVKQNLGLCGELDYSVLITCWSASGRHVLCHRGPTGSSKDTNCNQQPVVFYCWTTSLEQFTCYCLRHWLIFTLQETAESVSVCLTATAPVALNWHL